jgi:chromosome partitioning protein
MGDSLKEAHGHCIDTARHEVCGLGRIYAVVNQKGGVGKTTTAVNLSASLHSLGKKVLLIDFDPQGNATSGYGVNKATSPHVYDVIINGTDAVRAVTSTKWGDIIPSNKSLSGADIELVTQENREYRLRDSLSGLREQYEYIIIDCPPSLGVLTLNALCACDALLVPVQCEYYALEGLSNLTHTMRLVRQKLNPNLEMAGVLLTMYDSRTNLSLLVADEVKRYFPGKVFKTVIPRNVRLSEAPSHGLPILAYDRYSRGSAAYLEMAEELIQKGT